MQQTSPLRVYVNVPRAFADLVRIGTEGNLTLDEFPGRKFFGHVTNTARAVDPTSRALLTELQLSNETGELLPGAYGLITLQVNHDAGMVTILSNALLFIWFPPADIVAQILNFGLPVPIDVQIIGADQEANSQFASHLMNQIRKIPGAVDFRIQEPNNAPELDITMDRTKASILGINAQSVANSVLGALAGSHQNALNFWVDPKNGVSYHDAKLAQAQAQLKVAEAKRDLSKVTKQANSSRVPMFRSL